MLAVPRFVVTVISAHFLSSHIHQWAVPDRSRWRRRGLHSLASRREIGSLFLVDQECPGMSSDLLMEDLPTQKTNVCEQGRVHKQEHEHRHDKRAWQRWPVPKEKDTTQGNDSGHAHHA